MRLSLFAGGGLVRSAKSNALGNFRFANLPPGSYLLSAAEAGWYFKPVQRSLSLTGADLVRKNFTAYSW